MAEVRTAIVVLVRTDIAEIGRRGAVQCASIVGLEVWEGRHGRAQSRPSVVFEDVHCSVVRLALGGMAKSHVVSQSMHNPTLWR